VEEVLACYRGFPVPVRGAITTCVEDMVEGMMEFPAPAATGPAVEACANLEEVERYCHAVAGTVGILLCDLFARELNSGWLGATRAEEGRRFGLGLQLTNILKDREGDGRRGITYVPTPWLTPEGGLSDEGTRILVARAVEHLDRAQAFLLSIPPSRPEMRLFCLWAAHLALATLRLAARAQGRTAKVSRADLTVILETTRARAGEDSALQNLYLQSRGEVLAAITAG
jgi:farnesyl-diphosphate farnesyltransferase